MQSKPLEYDDMDGIKYQMTMANLLIEYGADLGIKNARKETPLVTAMETGNYYLAATLLEAGARFWEVRNENGNNFFHLFGDFIAYVNSLQPHYALDILQKERLVEAANRIWNAVEANSTSHMAEIRKTVSFTF